MGDLQPFAGAAGAALPPEMRRQLEPPPELAFGKVFEHRWRRYLSQGHAQDGGQVLGRYLVWACPIREERSHDGKRVVHLNPGRPLWVGEAPVLPQVINNRHFHSKDRPNLPPMPAGAIWIGRPRTLENKFQGRDALGQYRRWLWAQIQSRTPEVLRALSEIRETSILACACKPAPCHGDVIVKAWDYCRCVGLLSAPGGATA